MSGRSVGLAVAGVLLLSACGGAGSTADGDAADDASDGATADRKTAVAAVVDDVVVPAHTELADATATLADEVEALCAAPSTEQLSVARDAWWRAATARAAERPVAVGPAMDRSSKAELDWQADPERIDEALAGQDPVTPDDVSTGASGARGLLAAEHLLFGDGADALATADGARRCTYTASVATLAAGEARRLTEEFADGAADVLAGRGGVSMTTDGALNELVNTQVNTLDDLVDGRMAPDVAAEPGDGPADHETAMARATLDTVARLYEPRRLGGPLPDQTRDTVRGAIADAVAALPDADAVAVASTSPEPSAAHAAADAARVAVRTDVVSSLDVVLSFSDNDGDSG